jgi:carbonic anhydrase
VQEIKRFISGFATFRQNYFGPAGSVYDELQAGQSPAAMLIGCADSRVDPAILTGCAPGELFTVRNVANLAPPYDPDAGSSVGAALEFAVAHLEVSHVIVLGHSSCGGVKALLAEEQGGGAGGQIAGWMAQARPALQRVLDAQAGGEGRVPGDMHRAVEQASVLLSLENLATYPCVAERVRAGSLALHGWYFDLAAGELLAWDAGAGGFTPATR